MEIRIVHERDPEPVELAAGVSASTTFPGGLCQTILRLAPGAPCERTPDACEEVLFVLSGRGTVELAGTEQPLGPEDGVHVAPGESIRLRSGADEQLVIVSTRIDEPPPLPADAGPRRVVTRLADEPVREATSDRAFRTVFDNSSGCASVTQFVGYIPLGRTPDHYHEYEEVIYVLEGEGVMHAHGRDTPLVAGSCLHLPPRAVHCLERTSEAPMSVLGVFRPAISPAAAYYPDGTPAPVG
jgi:mannose-6-phosphate isomerase-like protein (cupin superfamily)